MQVEQTKLTRQESYDEAMGLLSTFTKTQIRELKSLS